MYAQSEEIDCYFVASWDLRIELACLLLLQMPEIPLHPRASK